MYGINGFALQGAYRPLGKKLFNIKHNKQTPYMRNKVLCIFVYPSLTGLYTTVPTATSTTHVTCEGLLCFMKLILCDLVHFAELSAVISALLISFLLILFLITVSFTIVICRMKFREKTAETRIEVHQSRIKKAML